MNKPKSHVAIYTDGGCDPNPGVGGYGAVLIFNNSRKELSGGDADTTNNRMELMAAIVALEALEQPHMIDLHTDSKYLKNGITKWLPKWTKNDWQTSRKQRVKNQDLWQQLHSAIQPHDITWHWVRGHAGHQGNERTHDLASAEIRKIRGDTDKPEAPDVPPDTPVKIYVCGRSRFDSAIGGWGVLTIENGHERELSDVVTYKSSDNQLSLMGAAVAIKSLQRPTEITVYTDNEYLQKGMAQWVKGWIKNNWQTSARKPVKNRELWEELITVSDKHTIYWLYQNTSDEIYQRALRLATKDLKRG